MGRMATRMTSRQRSAHGGRKRPAKAVGVADVQPHPSTASSASTATRKKVNDRQKQKNKTEKVSSINRKHQWVTSFIH